MIFLECVGLHVKTICRSYVYTNGCVIHTLCYISKGETGDKITFAQFEDGDLSSKTRDDTASGNKSDDDSTLAPLISEEGMDMMSSGNESDDEPMYIDMLEGICDGSQSNPSINRRKICYKICDCIKLVQV